MSAEDLSNDGPHYDLLDTVIEARSLFSYDLSANFERLLELTSIAAEVFVGLITELHPANRHSNFRSKRIHATILKCRLKTVKQQFSGLFSTHFVSRLASREAEPDDIQDHSLVA